MSSNLPRFIIGVICIAVFVLVTIGLARGQGFNPPGTALPDSLRTWEMIMDFDSDGTNDLRWQGDPTFRWNQPGIGEFTVLDYGQPGSYALQWRVDGIMLIDIDPTWTDSLGYAPVDTGRVDLGYFSRFGIMYQTPTFTMDGITVWGDSTEAWLRVPYNPEMRGIFIHFGAGLHNADDPFYVWQLAVPDSLLGAQ